MGYSHYWYRPLELDAEVFAAFAADVRRVIDACPPGLLGDGYSETRSPEATPERIWFNGLDKRPTAKERAAILDFCLNRYKQIVRYEDPPEKLYARGVNCDAGHETFLIPRVLTPSTWQTPCEEVHGWYFDCTKTAQKFYDIAVTAALILFAYHFPEAVQISSDGDAEEWVAGRELAREATDRPYLQIPPEIKPVLQGYRERRDTENVDRLLAQGHYRGQPLLGAGVSDD